MSPAGAWSGSCGFSTVRLVPPHPEGVVPGVSSSGACRGPAKHGRHAYKAPDGLSNSGSAAFVSSRRIPNAERTHQARVRPWVCRWSSPGSVCVVRRCSERTVRFGFGWNRRRSAHPAAFRTRRGRALAPVHRMEGRCLARCGRQWWWRRTFGGIGQGWVASGKANKSAG